MMSYDYPHPVSRTYQYKKITKPLLERKRRARINRCLEELKDLMMDALETEGENISKLEKADILELTVRHLQRLQASRPSGLSTSGAPDEDASGDSRWKSGFGHCAAEACKFLAALPGEAAERLAKHLASGLQAPHHLTDISSKLEVTSNTLMTMDRTTGIVAPCASADTVTDNDTYEGKIMAHPSYPINRQRESHESSIRSTTGKIQNRDAHSPIAKLVGSSTTTITAQKTTVKREDDCQSNIEEDEEIDVEKVDESSDPMWRPW